MAASCARAARCGAPARSAHGSPRAWRARSARPRTVRTSQRVTGARAGMRWRAGGGASLRRARAAAGMAVSVVGADSAFAAVPPADPAPRARCGMVTTGTLDDHHLIRSLARTLRRDWPALSLVVIGASLDDLDRMAAGNVFVLGPVEAGEYAKIIRHHRLGSLFVVTRQALVGQPNRVAARGRRPPPASP